MATADHVSPPLEPLLLPPELDELLLAEEDVEVDPEEPVVELELVDALPAVVEALLAVVELAVVEVLLVAEAVPLDPLDSPVEAPLPPSPVEPELPVVDADIVDADIVVGDVEADREEEAELLEVVASLAAVTEAPVEPLLAVFDGATGVPQAISGTAISHIP